VTGTVRDLHERSAADLSRRFGSGRAARVLQPTDSALVLGSTQAEGIADRAACEAAAVEVVRRRSGGAAVLVRPGAMVWVDLVVPAGDPLWCADVGHAAWWVGEAWARALTACGLSGLEVWKGPFVARPWSSLVCFAGLGAGEVTLAAGSKVVGISQRRVRSAALFQCACLLSWEPGALLALLALAPDQRMAAARELAHVAGVTGTTGGEVLGHLLEELPEPSGKTIT
jgi:lipoate---protein ligase